MGMKGRSGRLIVIGLFLIGVAVIGNLILYAFGVSPFNVATIREVRAIPAEGVSQIEVFSNFGDVRVVSGGQEITVKMTGKAERQRLNEYHLSVTERDGGRLVIEASRDDKRRLVSMVPGDYELLVELPDRLYEQLRIETELANISAEGVQAKRVTVRTEHGDIATAGLSGKIEAQAVTGNIRLGVLAIADDMEAQTVYGDIAVLPDEPPESLSLKLETRFGEKKVELPETETGASGTDAPTLKLTSVVGDITVKAASAP